MTLPIKESSAKMTEKGKATRKGERLSLPIPTDDGDFTPLKALFAENSKKTPATAMKTPK